MSRQSATSSSNLSTSASTTSISATISKALTAKSDWPDKEEFLDVIYWARQVVGVVIGLLWGLAALQGAVALVGFAAINAGVLYVYFSGFQAIDEEVS